MTYRSKKLLDMAREAPHCMLCGADNHGQVVACHSGKWQHGHGMGMKSADWSVAYCCNACHDLIDGRADIKKYTKPEREAMHAEAFYRTIGWLIESGRLVLK